MKLSAKHVPELRAMALALKAVDRDLRKRIYAAWREQMNPVWKGAVAGNIRGRLQERVITGGTLIKAGNPPVLQAAASRRKVGRGLVPNDMWPGFEYGADREAYSRYQRRSPKGTVHTVERRTMRHLPPRKRNGHVLGPAVAETLPRLASMAAQITVRTIMQPIDNGKG